MGMYSINIGESKKNIYRNHLKMGGFSPRGEHIGFTNYYAEKNGKPFFGICAEFHFSRCSYLYWEQDIRKIKAAGVNIISSYIFWNHHEEDEGVFTWDGNKNLRYFVDLCAKNNIYVILRIGPFAHGEVKNGGIPDWLYGRPFTIRSNSPEYLSYTKRFFNEIGIQVKGQMFKDNGPVIGVQLENEHMHASPGWDFMVMKDNEWLEIGRDDAEHIKALKKLAIEAGIEAPIYTCTGWGGASYIEDETLPLYGGYSFCPWFVNEEKDHVPTNEYLIQSFHDNSSKCVEFNPPYPREKYPYACCELGAGMACWYKYRFVVEPESVKAATIVKIAGGCNFIGYYMFHDGTNPIGKHGYLNERVVPKISYNFQAPIGEYGQIMDSYKMLKPLFYFLEECQETLCLMGTTLPEEAQKLVPEDNETLRYAIRQKDGSGFIFAVNYQDHFKMKDIENASIELNLPGERLLIPRKGGFTLKRNVSAILPFNMKLCGVTLKYSTTQFVTSVFDGTTRTYFFFAIAGMESGYCFVGDGSTSISVEGGTAHDEGDFTDVQVKPGMDSVISIVSPDGTETRICTLTAEQALGLWKFKLWGRDRIIISEADLLAEDGRIEASTRNKAFSLNIFPAVEGELCINNKKLKSTMSGIFQTFETEVPQNEINTEVTDCGEGNYNIKFPADLLEKAEEVFLQIDYRGSIGNAFVDGVLVSDNFCNGETWEIGLRRIRPGILGNDMYLHIIPFKKGNEVKFDPAIRFANEMENGQQIAKADSIKAVAEYKLNIYKV